MIYVKPQVITLRSALDAIGSIQQKALSPVAESEILVNFDPAYEVDE